MSWIYFAKELFGMLRTHAKYYGHSEILRTFTNITDISEYLGQLRSLITIRNIKDTPEY